jgi:hypothetical protein
MECDIEVLKEPIHPKERSERKILLESGSD